MTILVANNISREFECFHTRFHYQQGTKRSFWFKNNILMQIFHIGVSKLISRDYSWPYMIITRFKKVAEVIVISLKRAKRFQFDDFAVHFKILHPKWSFYVVDYVINHFLNIQLYSIEIRSWNKIGHWGSHAQNRNFSKSILIDHYLILLLRC